MIKFLPVLSVAQLIGWYRFSEVISNIQYDMSGNLNHAVCSKASPSLGPHGLIFNGLNDYLDLPSNSVESSSLDLSSPFTITIWLQRKTIGPDRYCALFELKDSTRIFILRIKIESSTNVRKYPQLNLDTSEGSFQINQTEINADFGYL